MFFFDFLEVVGRFLKVFGEVVEVFFELFWTVLGRKQLFNKTKTKEH